MYLAVSVILTFTSLGLGSFWALIPALLLPVVLAARIGNEEQLLRRDLPGYVEYCQKVKYRVLPFIW
jgi:protein-S-isoprenylcysteine O-methyltransferase Ste14